MSSVAIDAIKTVPLEKDEYDTLRYIYIKRRRLLVGALAGMLIFEVLAACKIMQNYPEYWDLMKMNASDVRLGDYKGELIFLLCFYLFLTTACAIIFFRRVYPFRKDYKSGLKELVPFAIIRKEYFPFSNQYFVFFDDAKYAYHEVDADVYTECTQGTIIRLNRGIYSKHIFEKDGRFTVM